MKKVLFVCCLFVLSAFFSGCIIVSSNKTQPAPKSCPPAPQTNATIAEIDAVAKLASQSARANVYKAIAQRPNLSTEERIHLTNAITTHLASQTDREDVLLVLVNNVPEPKPTVVIQETASEAGAE